MRIRLQLESEFSSPGLQTGAKFLFRIIPKTFKRVAKSETDKQ